MQSVKTFFEQRKGAPYNGTVYIVHLIMQDPYRSDWTCSCIATTKCYKILESLSNTKFPLKWHFEKTYGLSS